MKVHLWAFGSSSDSWVGEGEKIYAKRIEHYMPFEYKIIQPTKNKLPEKVLQAEAAWIKVQLAASPSKLILLDERGTQYTSPRFSQKLDAWRQGSHKRLVFLIGSAYGLDEEVHQMADHKVSLSSMTLPHQLCRLLFLEQIYRACTILKGENYHHT